MRELKYILEQIESKTGTQVSVCIDEGKLSFMLAWGDFGCVTFGIDDSDIGRGSPWLIDYVINRYEISRRG